MTGRYEIHDTDQFVTGFFADSSECDDTLRSVVRIDPFESVPAVVDLPERFFLLIETIKRADVILHLTMIVVLFSHKPFELLGFVPFDKRSEFGAHKRQLFTRVSKHEREQQPVLIEFHVVFTEHFVDQRFFAVNYFVM